MIDPFFLAFDENGLYCATGNFYIDPQKPVQNALISHAHGDHAIGGHGHVYCTEPTAILMQCRLKKNTAKVFHTFSYKQPFKLGGIEIELISAGHILGSAQILLKHNGVTYLYTGDYKLQEDSTCYPIEFMEADVLITESTFAHPEIKHPDPVREIQKLNQVNHNILLGAYALGKSQRLIAMLSHYCPSRTLLVHHSILPINRVYEHFSFLPGRYEPYNRKLMKEPGKGYVYIVPPMPFNSYFRAKNVMRVFASGWQRLQKNNDLELYISDHADWHDILLIIDRVKPQEIWTLHGDGSYLKRFFKGKISVKAL